MKYKATRRAYINGLSLNAGDTIELKKDEAEAYGSLLKKQGIFKKKEVKGEDKAMKKSEAKTK